MKTKLVKPRNSPLCAQCRLSSAPTAATGNLPEDCTDPRPGLGITGRSCQGPGKPRVSEGNPHTGMSQPCGEQAKASCSAGEALREVAEPCDSMLMSLGRTGPHLSCTEGQQRAWQGTAQGTAQSVLCCHPARLTLPQQGAGGGPAVPELPTEQAEPTRAAWESSCSTATPCM